MANLELGNNEFLNECLYTNKKNVTMLERWQKKKKNNKTAKEMNEPAPKFTLNPASELLAKLGMKYEKRKVEWFSSVPRA